MSMTSHHEISGIAIPFQAPVYSVLNELRHQVNDMNKISICV